MWRLAEDVWLTPLPAASSPTGFGFLAACGACDAEYAAQPISSVSCIVELSVNPNTACYDAVGQL